MSEEKSEIDQTTKVTEETQEAEANLTKPSEQIIDSDNHLPEQVLTTTADKKKSFNFYKLLRIVFFLGFVIFALLFINEVFLTPYRINKSIEKTNNLYKTNRYYSSVTATPTPTQPPLTDTSEVETDADTTTKLPVYDPTRDDKGRLLQFADLLAVNEDVKGWITIPDSNIDYVVMQSGSDDPEYYLNRDIEKQELKAGSLFLDYKCSVEENSKNLTIHGHNMTSTDNMFHYLIKFKELDYYKERPVFTFDTILQTGQWKIFSIFITNGGSEKEEFFNYTRSDFKDSSDFLNYVYQLRIRSLFNIDPVDINENDQLLTLSTCSYEVKNYRTVIVARKVREGEDPSVDVDRVTVNEKPLFPYTYYYRFGGKAPELTGTFEEALAMGEINWYVPLK